MQVGQSGDFCAWGQSFAQERLPRVEEQIHMYRRSVLQPGFEVLHCLYDNTDFSLVDSEPFERNNVARAVHEKIKFDIIKAQFAEVHAKPLKVLVTVFPFMWFSFFFPLSSSKSVWVSHDLFSVLLLLISLTQSCRILQKWRDLNAIIPLKDIINKESSRRWRGWGDSSDWTGHLPLKTSLSAGTKWRKNLRYVSGRALLDLHRNTAATPVPSWPLMTPHDPLWPYIAWTHVDFRCGCFAEFANLPSLFYTELASSASGGQDSVTVAWCVGSGGISGSECLLPVSLHCKV